MAYIITAKILVDEPQEEWALAGLNDILARAQARGDGEAGSTPAILDWSLASAARVNDHLADAIVNETYQSGDAFADFVIFSRSEAIRGDGQAGFWSNEYGWTTLDLATKFDVNVGIDLPVSHGQDAVWMPAPYGLNFMRLKLIEEPAQSMTTIVFECFAEDFNHALEQAENAYPGSMVVLEPVYD